MNAKYERFFFLYFCDLKTQAHFLNISKDSHSIQYFSMPYFEAAFGASLYICAKLIVNAHLSDGF